MSAFRLLLAVNSVAICNYSYAHGIDRVMYGVADLFQLAVFFWYFIYTEKRFLVGAAYGVVWLLAAVLVDATIGKVVFDTLESAEWTREYAPVISLGIILFGCALTHGLTRAFRRKLSLRE